MSDSLHQNVADSAAITGLCWSDRRRRPGHPAGLGRRRAAVVLRSRGPVSHLALDGARPGRATPPNRRDHRVHRHARPDGARLRDLRPRVPQDHPARLAGGSRRHRRGSRRRIVDDVRGGVRPHRHRAQPRHGALSATRCCLSCTPSTTFSDPPLRSYSTRYDGRSHRDVATLVDPRVTRCLPFRGNESARSQPTPN